MPHSVSSPGAWSGTSKRLAEGAENLKEKRHDDPTVNRGTRICTPYSTAPRAGRASEGQRHSDQAPVNSGQPSFQIGWPWSAGLDQHLNLEASEFSSK